VQVVATDTASGSSATLLQQPHSVLCLLPDAQSRTLFVSTTSSSVGAFRLPPRGLPSSALGVLPLVPRSASPPPSARDAKSALRDGAVIAIDLLENGNDTAEVSTSAHRPAGHTARSNGATSSVERVLWLEGHPPLVRFAAFDDRRHVLTLDAEGKVALWDVVWGKHVEEYDPGTVRLCPHHADKAGCGCHITRVTCFWGYPQHLKNDYLPCDVALASSPCRRTQPRGHPPCLLCRTLRSSSASSLSSSS
jgi:hypothetical protein